MKFVEWFSPVYMFGCRAVVSSSWQTPVYLQKCTHTFSLEIVGSALELTILKAIMED